jgi:ornithine racemase
MSAVLSIDLAVIEANARSIADRLRPLGVSVAGVTKGVCGDPEVARAMLAGGCAQIADSRLENLGRLKEERLALDGPLPELWLLRAPPPDEAEAAVGVADVSLATDASAIRALSAAAAGSGLTHGIVLMVELGDLREGLMPAEVPTAARQVAGLPGLELLGVGANLTCHGGVIPDEKNLGELVSVAEEVERSGGAGLKWVSGGATSSLRMAFGGQLPSRVDHLRVGEGILLGKDTIDRSDLAGTGQDAFTLKAPVTEIALKPSAPWGEIGQDSWGRAPQFADRGPRLRACVAIGRQDIGGGRLAPLEGGVAVMGASADLLILDVQDAAPGLSAGSVLSFRPDYAALAALATSPYVEKQYVRRPAI